MDQRDLREGQLRRAYARRASRAAAAAAGSHATPEALLAVVQREGPEHDRLATLDHVMACAACHREYEWLTAVDRAGFEAEGSATGNRRRAWWSGAPLALAASIAVAVGAAVVLSGILRTGTERERGTGSDIATIGPDSRAPAGSPLTFTWHPAPGAGRYVLEVQGPGGSIVLADTTADTAVTIAQPGLLLPDSAYRWWVREVTDGAEPRSSAFRDLRLTAP